MHTIIIWILFSISICPALLHSQENYRISYGEPLPLEGVNIPYKFSFKEKDKMVSLIGDQIHSYLFRYPGQYIISIEPLDHNHPENKEECHAIKLPPRIRVDVDSIKIVFKHNTLALSRAIRKNENTNGIVATIDVEVFSYYQNPILMNTEIIRTAGIGTSIVAELDSSQFKLSSGNHQLKYHLRGICSELSFIQFDFKAHNGNIIPIGLKSQIVE